MTFALKPGQGQGCRRPPLLAVWDDFPRFFQPFNVVMSNADGESVLGTLSVLDNGSVIWESGDQTVQMWTVDPETQRLLDAPVTMRHNGQIVAIATTTIHGYLKLHGSEGVGHTDVVERAWPHEFKNLMDTGHLPESPGPEKAKVSTDTPAPTAEPATTRPLGTVIRLSEAADRRARTAEARPEETPQPIGWSDVQWCRDRMRRAWNSFLNDAWRTIHNPDGPSLILGTVLGSIVAAAAVLLIIFA